MHQQPTLSVNQDPLPIPITLQMDKEYKDNWHFGRITAYHDGEIACRKSWRGSENEALCYQGVIRFLVVTFGHVLVTLPNGTTADCFVGWHIDYGSDDEAKSYRTPPGC